MNSWAWFCITVAAICTTGLIWNLMELDAPWWCYAQALATFFCAFVAGAIADYE